MKIRKFARKRKTTKTIWIQKAWLWKSVLNFEPRLPTVPHQVTCLSGGCRGELVDRKMSVKNSPMKIAEPEPEAPGPGATTVDDVFLAEPGLLGAEEARPRDQAPDDQVDQATEADHDAHGGDDRAADAQVGVVPEPEVGGRAREDRDERRDPRQLAQLRGKGDRLLARAQQGRDGRLGCGRGGCRSSHPAPQFSRVSAYSLYAEVDSLDFSHQDIERAARYHRPRYVALFVELVLSVAVLAFLQWGWPGPWHLVDGLGWAGAAAAYAALVTALGEIVRLPVSFWRGHLQERRCGFSTQSARGWLVDLVKGETVGLAADGRVLDRARRACPLASLGVARCRRCRRSRSPSRSLPLLRLSCSSRSSTASVPSPTSSSPRRLRSLAEHAGVPVRDVLVADASRRTTKVNAYVSGLGKTRRVVVYDTLLEAAADGELEVVVAHELGHRRERHIAKITLGGMAGAALWVVLLWALLGSRIADPRELPLVLLISLGLRLAVSRSRRGDLPALGARRRPLVARADPRPAGVRAHAPHARAEESRRPRAAATRLPAALLAPDGARASRARPSVGGGLDARAQPRPLARSRPAAAPHRARPDPRAHGRRDRRGSPRRLARAARRCGPHAHRRGRARRCTDRVTPCDAAGAGAVDVRPRAGGDPRRAGERPHAVARRHLDRLRRRVAPRRSAERARRRRPRRRSRRRRGESRRNRRARTRRPREPEHAWRVSPRRDRPRRVRRHRGRRRARARDRLGSLRRDRRPARRGAHVPVELVAPPGLGPDLPRGLAGRRRSGRCRTGARRRPPMSSACTTSTSGR